MMKILLNRRLFFGFTLGLFSKCYIKILMLMESHLEIDFNHTDKHLELSQILKKQKELSKAL